MKVHIYRVLLSVALIVCLCMCVFSTAAIDLDAKGSIKVHLQYQGKPVSGGNLILYHVAVPVWNNGEYIFKFTKEFEDCNLSLTDLNQQETAAKYSEYVISHSLQGITRRINADGKATFTDLPIGLFLVVQEVAASGFFPITPFLISVPQKVDGKWNYDVDATPKIGIEREPEPEKPPVKPNIPGTGQLKWPIPVLAISGVFMLGIGFVLCFKGKRKE